MGKETIMRDGDFVLCDCDVSDLDPVTTDRLYCISYVESGKEYEIMLIWRRGETVRSRSIGTTPTGYGCSAAHVRSLTRLMSYAQDLLDGKK